MQSKVEKILKNLQIKCTIGIDLHCDNITPTFANNARDLLISTTIIFDLHRNKFICQLNEKYLNQNIVLIRNIRRNGIRRKLAAEGKRGGKLVRKIGEAAEMSKFKTRTPCAIGKSCGEVAFGIGATSRSCRLRLRHVDPINLSTKL